MLNTLADTTVIPVIILKLICIYKFDLIVRSRPIPINLCFFLQTSFNTTKDIPEQLIAQGSAINQNKHRLHFLNFLSPLYRDRCINHLQLR